jgi:hypothetical protein
MNTQTSTTPVTTFTAFTAIAAAVASIAAFGSLSLGLAPWAMFVGWVAYFTRPTSARQGLANYLCLVLGLISGVGAVFALGTLTPMFGQYTIAVVVFVVASIVISLRAVPLLDNTLAWFLGLIAFFAAHLEPSIASVAELGSVGGIGSFAAWTVQTLQRRLAGASHHH